ncbi:MAG TPA: T9SS type A sorting domain-containing protein, partial [Chitinophagales bacterium]|nr:T9SS type A sorting domain-containing protein [Chitinophagales bacterium]
EYFPVTVNDANQTNFTWGKPYPVEWSKTMSGTFSNYCSDNSVDEMVNDNIGIVFPVPSNDNITFDFSKINSKPLFINIYNIHGNEVSHMKVLSSPLTLSVSDIGSDGIYLYTVNFIDGSICSGKILIQR